MHALGWTRAKAIETMRRIRIGPESDVENEVDRYIVWPGQALAYKAGQLELLRLRGATRDRLGAAFDIRGFHDAVLDQGALPLATLARVIDDWIEGARKD
jgi:uncharacterized protein (DUF885 family)